VPEEDLPGLLAGCRAFIFPGLEDFGIAPVQALAAGRPVVAFAGGGALDTVQEGVNGVLFQTDSVDSLCEALRRFEQHTFQPAALRATAARFDRKVFEAALSTFVEEKAHA
jgi:glycosyltransferase involved in cell wall biosynthesis